MEYQLIQVLCDKLAVAQREFSMERVIRETLNIRMIEMGLYFERRGFYSNLSGVCYFLTVKETANKGAENVLTANGSSTSFRNIVNIPIDAVSSGGSSK